MKAPARFKTKSGRRPRARLHAGWSPIGRRHARSALLRVLGVLGMAVLLLAVAGDVYAQSFLDSLPSVRGLDSAAFNGDALIYDRGGTLLADLGKEGDHRLNVSLDQVSPRLIQATVAIEDRNFYRNPGFDPEGIARAALANYQAHAIVGGGSTITQQLAKRLFLSPDQTFERKLRELALAYQLSRSYSKNQILQLYLNQSYYGDQQYGVQAASRTFFQKDARDLDLAQVALLAGIPQAPAQWSPVVHPDQAKVRQKQVLDAMVRQGDVTSEQADAAFGEPLKISPPVNSFRAPHFVDYVKKELEGLGFKIGQQQITVRTTLDYGKQQLAQTVVVDNLNANRFRDQGGLLSSALVSVDPRTGEILVMVGSPDYNADAGQFNFVADRSLNPGSSVKPFTYAAVINARKATMDTPIADSPNPLELPSGPGQAPYQVYNYDRALHGVLPLRQALQNSLNIPAVKTELAVGVPAVVEFWRNLGLRPRMAHRQPDSGYTYTTDDSIYDFGASLTLGGYPVTLLDEVGALSVFADLGVHHQPEAILEVTDGHGKVLYQADPQRGQRQALDPGVAFIMASIMADDQNRGLIFGLNSPLHLAERTAAAKTGTTSDFKDALAVGFTPDLATVVWVGDVRDSTHTMVSGSDGVFVAAPAWHRFMTEALKGVPDRWYQPPGNLVRGPGGSWYLADATSIPKLPNDNPTPRPSPPDYGIPGDPGSGPHPVAVPAPATPPTPAPGGPPIPPAPLPKPNSR